MPKLIIYLDQNFVSNMAKAKFLGAPGLASRFQEYGALYDLLKAHVDNDKVICPESLFHELETIEPNLAKAAQTVVTRLSYGLRFRCPMEIIRFQAYRAAREFLNLHPEGTPQWQDAFEDNPHEPVQNRTIPLGTGKILLTIPWQIDTSPPKPDKYMNDRKAAGGKLTWDDLQMRIREQKDGLIQCIYGNRIQKFSLGEGGLLWETWQSLGAAQERLADFLKSDQLRNCPFIDIHCTLTAAMNCETNRQPSRGDALDTQIMAVVLPYCRIVATSKDMVALLHQTHLAGGAPKSFYSAKPPEVQEFAKWLAAL